MNGCQIVYCIEHGEPPLEMLVDEKMIRKSLVLPFRYASALDGVEKRPGATAVVRALSRAVDIACANVPRFAGRTLVIVDDSGSMHGTSLSRHSKSDPAHVASLFAAVLAKANPAADLRTGRSRGQEAAQPTVLA